MRSRVAPILGVELLGFAGWSVAGYPAAGMGISLGVLLVIVPWFGLSLVQWAGIYRRRKHKFRLVEPVTVVNDRCGGGVRYQEGFATVAIQVLGKARSPARLVGATAPTTDDTIDLCDLYRLMRQPLGLRIASIDVITTGARRFPAGDYPRVYDTLIGPSPYAGRRDTWLMIRLDLLGSTAALQSRVSIGTAAIAAAQRIAAELRFRGIRSRVATMGDISELELRLERAALDTGRRGWFSVNTESGYLTTYGYRPVDISSETLAQAWSLRVDELVQRITLYPTKMTSATITVRTSQPPLTPPSVLLQSLPGEQNQAVAGHLCGPPRRLRNVGRGRAPSALVLPIGSSGVLLGRNPLGERVLLPITDSVDFARIEITAEDAIAKRLLIRAAATGVRITVHTEDSGRWESIRMPNISITDQSKPAVGTTLSVVDGSVTATPRPNTVVSVSPAGSTPTPTGDISITQIGPRTIRLETSYGTEEVEVDLFRAENRYIGDSFAPVVTAAIRFGE
jgi:type VII secretion protein EccE